MSKEILYIVGKPDQNAHIHEYIHGLGYLLGILADKRLVLKNPDRFDSVIPVDFTDLDNEIARLTNMHLTVAGLLCTFENYIIAKAKLASVFNAPSISANSAEMSTDKALMREAFMKADRTISPNYTAINTIEEALAFADAYGYPLILKPTNLVKSLLVLRCDTKESLVKNFTYALDTIDELYEKYNIYNHAPQIIIEEFITGTQYSVAAFVDKNGNTHFCEGTVGLTTAQDVNVDDTYLYKRVLPVTLDPKVESEIFRVAKIGIDALGLRSVPAHVELMYDDQAHVKIIEIGARIGGYRPRMYSQCYGVNLSEQEVNLALDRELHLQGQFKKYCAVYELFPTRTGNFTKISEDIDVSICTYFRVTAKIGDIIGQAKNGFKAAAIIIIADNNLKTFSNRCSVIEKLAVEVA